MNTHTNRRSGTDRRTASLNITFPLLDNQGITIVVDRRISCDRRTSGLELTELNISQKVFQTAFKKFQSMDS